MIRYYKGIVKPKSKNMIHVVHCPYCDKRVEVECSEYSTHLDYENRLIKEFIEYCYNCINRSLDGFENNFKEMDKNE